MDIKTIAELTISTVAIIISVYSVIKTSRDNNKILEANSRAYVSVYTESMIANRQFFYLVFRNFGKTNAFIKDIKIDKKTREIINSKNLDRLHYLNDSNLAPNQSFTHIVLSSNEELDHVSTIKITYLSGDKTYTDKFKFNLADHTRMPSIGLSNSDYEKQFLELYQDSIRKNL